MLQKGSTACSTDSGGIENVVFEFITFQIASKSGDNDVQQNHVENHGIPILSPYATAAAASVCARDGLVLIFSCWGCGASEKPVGPDGSVRDCTVFFLVILHQKREAQSRRPLFGGLCRMMGWSRGCSQCRRFDLHGVYTALTDPVQLVAKCFLVKLVSCNLA